jgi:tRNA (guanine37-N1)-methyltransferase
LNLKEPYLPYKEIVAQVLLDKNPSVKTVINKTDSIGMESEFRTFSYEVLAGPDVMDVELIHNNCVFKFNYSEVYWNSKLDTEHARLISLFKEGEVVCDVMAGIGPFAIPAGKKGVFVWANDKNPRSYFYLETAIKLNKVCLAKNSFVHRSLMPAGLGFRQRVQRRWPRFYPEGCGLGL